MKGPTLYARLMDRANSAPELELREHVAEVVGDLTATLSDHFAACLRNAYAEGVRDGFQQGVQAAEERPA